MPPRIPLLAAVRQSTSYVRSQVCQFSKSASPKALFQNPPGAAGNTVDRRMLDLDSAPTQRAGRSALVATEDMLNVFRRDREKDLRTKGKGAALDTTEELKQKDLQSDYMRQMPRRFEVGDVYAPHDLSPVEMRKWRKWTTEKHDLVDLLALRPVDMYRNFSFISEYITPFGRIKRRDQTGLRPVNQRKLAKAIRRSIGLGLHPSVHRHPELLMRERRSTQAQSIPSRFGLPKF